jgi:hypothetical protein
MGLLKKWPYFLEVRPSYCSIQRGIGNREFKVIRGITTKNRITYFDKNCNDLIKSQVNLVI